MRQSYQCLALEERVLIENEVRRVNMPPKMTFASVFCQALGDNRSSSAFFLTFQSSYPVAQNPSGLTKVISASQAACPLGVMIDGYFPFRARRDSLCRLANRPPHVQI